MEQECAYIGVLAAERKYPNCMRRLLPFTLLLLILSCASRRGQSTDANLKASDLYSEVTSAINSYNDTAKARIVLQHKSFNPTKAVFEKLSGELANSEALIYLFTWENNLPTITNNFRAIVIDKTTGKAYYAFKSEAGNMVNVATTVPDEFLIEDFLLKNYSQNGVDFLKSLQNRFSSTEMGQDYVIYEVDLISHTNKVTMLNSVTIDKNELTRLEGS
jgi:hypothetical protein